MAIPRNILMLSISMSYRKVPHPTCRGKLVKGKACGKSTVREASTTKPPITSPKTWWWTSLNNNNSSAAITTPCKKSHRKDKSSASSETKLTTPATCHCSTTNVRLHSSNRKCSPAHKASKTTRSKTRLKYWTKRRR